MGLPGSLDRTGLCYLGALALMLWLLRKAQGWYWMFSFIVLPGTLCHELCHWCTGKLLNGQPVRFTVIPRREGRGLVLGSVHFAHVRWYNAFFIGVAPVVLLPLALGLLLWRLRMNPVFGWKEAAMVFLLSNLVFGAIPSWQDLKVAARSPIGWLGLLGGGIFLWMKYGR